MQIFVGGQTATFQGFACGLDVGYTRRIAVLPSGDSCGDVTPADAYAPRS